MLAAPLQSETLQELAANETKESKKATATEGMMWLFRYEVGGVWLLIVFRGLNFTATALRRSITIKSEELSSSFTEAYGVALKKYHSLMVRPVFSVPQPSSNPLLHPGRVDLRVLGCVLIVVGDESVSLSCGFL